MVAKLQTFRSPGRAEVLKLNFISLPVKAERKSGSEASDFQNPGRTEVRKLNFMSMAFMAGPKCGSGVHIFGKVGRAEVRNGTHVTSWVVKAERKCGSEVSDL